MNLKDWQEARSKVAGTFRRAWTLPEGNGGHLVVVRYLADSRNKARCSWYGPYEAGCARPQIHAGTLKALLVEYTEWRFNGSPTYE